MPGQTPFLLSSTFLKQIKAVIDTDVGTMWSKELQKSLEISKSPKNLYLMDINQLWDSTADAEGSAQTFASDVTSKSSTDSEKPCIRLSSKSRVEAGSLGQNIPESKPGLETCEDFTAPHFAVARPEISEPNCVSSHSPDHGNVLTCSQVQGVRKGRSTTDTAGSPQCCQKSDTAGTGGREDSFRSCQEGIDVQAGVRGCLLDGVHTLALREEREAGPYDVHSVHQASRGSRHQGQSMQGDGGLVHDQDGSTSSQRGVGRTAESGGRQHDPSVIAAGGRDDQPPSGESKSGSPHGADRDGDAGGARSSSQDECQGRGLEHLSAQEAQDLHCRAYAESIQLNAHVDVDFEFHDENPNNSFSKTCKRLIQQYQQELKQVQEQLSHHRMSVPKLDVLEVMCSDHSELAKQADSLGGRARRFGLSQGDLQTVAGRRKLYEILILGSPEHVWYSPECGPWSMWSNFNMGRSMDGFHDVLEKRRQSLWQLSLAVVLFRFQVSRSKHFHLEQPDGSKMLIQECLREIRENTEVCRFDLCRVGSLRDPISAMPIRKRLSVCTTSQAVHRAIHGKWCNQDHEHKQIAGSTKVGNQRMPLSSFTEHYPRKFARQLAKIMLYDKGQVPIYAVRSGESSHDDNAHPTKKRRVGQKLSPEEIARRFAPVNWQTAMDMANQLAPRVGPRVIESGPLIQVVQKLCPDHTVVHVVLCRGTDRYMGPTKAMTPGSAPLRRRICIRRRHEDLAVDSEWEPWERLSLRALRRQGVAARVSLTVSARVPDMQPSDQSSLTQSSASAVASKTRLVSELAGMENGLPESKRFRASTAEIDQTAAMGPEVIDLASQKHGPKFLALDTETQNWLLKLHRHLGHPGAAKLIEFCRQLGCPDQILQAIGELKCSTCLEQKAPTVSRPSAIHDSCDFGDIVSMDGVTWTNADGQQFHFYHFVDQSTVFQTAVATAGHSATHAIRALNQGWMQWAGLPNMLCIDAGTELNSEEFLEALQRNNIKSRTIATDAHWQNSRAERHGAILKQILSKMDHEDRINSFEKLEISLSMATHTKNQWSRHRGYPPEVLVFGKTTKIPGSIVSSSDHAAHMLAESNLPEGIRFREELATRERARKAFAETDNSQTLRRALLQRSRPTRGHYVHGDHVMMWKKKGEADGNWIGPLRVVLQDGNHVVWVTMGQKLYRIAPEHLRPLSAVEDWKLSTNEELSSKINTNNLHSIIPPHGGTQFHNLIQSPIPDTANTSNNDNRNVHDDTQDNDAIIPINMPHQSHDQPESPPSEQPDGEPLPNVSTSSDEQEAIAASSGEDPSKVPIPDDGDDDLYVHDEPVFHLNVDQCWQLEVNISQHDVNMWRQESRPTEMAFLVSAAKRQRSEVKMTNLSPEDREKFQDAKAKEIESWITTETITKIARNQIPRENILRSRWILTWKEIDGSVQHEGSPKYKPKARLVVLGFEDPQVENIPRDSPTMNKLSRTFVLQMAASRQWTIQSFDIQTAFLRGSEQGSRILGMEPPEEMRKRLKLKPTEVVQLLKGAYGRVDAPYLWFMELKKSLEDLQFQQSPFDPCLFVLTDVNTQETIGMIGVHVDDGLCCGNTVFEKKLMQLQEKYPFGSHKKTEFTFTGLHIKQHADFGISVDQTQYVKDIAPIQLTRERRLQHDDPVTENERQSLRAVIGSLQYAAVNTRPDLCSRLGWLQSRINHAQVSTLQEANRVLHEAKQHADVSINIQPIDQADLRFVAFSDASFASAKTSDSHQGMIIMAAHKGIGNNQRSSINPIVWHSKKIQKVAVSTLSAEAMALAGAVDILTWVRLFWAWICNTGCDWRRADKTLLQLPPAFSALTPEEESITTQPPNNVTQLTKQLSKDQSSMITTDCKSLFDLISRTAPPACTEFRTLLQAKLIKEHIHNGIMIRWVPSAAQIADALTKVMDNTILRTCLRQGFYSLHDEAEILKARSDARSRLKWMQAQNPDASRSGEV